MKLWLVGLLLIALVVSGMGAIKLVIWCGGGTEREGIQAAVTEYKKINPDVDFELIDVPYPSTSRKSDLVSWVEIYLTF